LISDTSGMFSKSVDEIVADYLLFSSIHPLFIKFSHHFGVRKFVEAEISKISLPTNYFLSWLLYKNGQNYYLIILNIFAISG